MSQKNVKLFYEELSKNKELQEKITKANEKYTGQKIDEKSIDLILQNELLPIAKEAGFDFTLEELYEFAKKSNQSFGGRLSDDELDAVVGGWGFCPGIGLSDGGCFCFIAGAGQNPRDKGGCAGVGVFTNNENYMKCQFCGGTALTYKDNHYYCLNCNVIVM